jgi:hypothetical protein
MPRRPDSKKPGSKSLKDQSGQKPEASQEREADPVAQAIDEQVEVAANSLEACIGYHSLLRELQHAYLERVAYYRSKEGGSLSIDEARAKAFYCKDEAEARELYDQLMSLPVDLVDFDSLAELWGADPRAAQSIWEMMKFERADEFESGHLASKAMTPTRYMRTAWNVACYLGVRESLVLDWQPRGGIELTLIDMLAQAFLQYQHWLQELVLRSQSEPRRETPEYTQWKSMRRVEQKEWSWGPGYWDIPYVPEQEALEHAAQMADRWNRIYMRTLRNLRDLRRYQVPVTINNPQQVNIAGDGGKQVNVSRSEQAKG